MSDVSNQIKSGNSTTVRPDDLKLKKGAIVQGKILQSSDKGLRVEVGATGFLTIPAKELWLPSGCSDSSQVHKKGAIIPVRILSLQYERGQYTGLGSEISARRELLADAFSALTTLPNERPFDEGIVVRRAGNTKPFLNVRINTGLAAGFEAFVPLDDLPGESPSKRFAFFASLKVGSRVRFRLADAVYKTLSYDYFDNGWIETHERCVFSISVKNLELATVL